MVIASIGAVLTFGLNYGIDFTGGSLLEIGYETEMLTTQEVRDVFTSLELEEPVVQASGESGAIIRFVEVNEDMHQKILESLNAALSEKGGTVREDRFESIGPSIGEELAGKSINALIVVLIAIVLYISWVFRKVSKPVASWKYGLIALVTLFHDVVIVVGFFALVGYYFDWQINTPFIAALLTVLGYSVNDTIIVFDRIRENIRLASHTYEEVIDMSVIQTMSRSINTSVTTLLVLGAIFFFGGASIQSFVLALILGIIIGTYSSIFLASPLLGIWYRFQKK